MNPYLAIPLGYILDYLPAAALAAAILALVAPERFRRPVEWSRKNLSLPLVIACCLFACALAAVVYHFWDRSRGPIIWLFTPSASPIAWSGDSSGSFYFSAFQFVGHNRWDEPITPTEAYVESNITKLKVLLTFNSQKPIDSGTIQPDANFVLISTPPWLNPQSKPNARVIQEEFGSFTFVFRSPQKNYSIRFDRSQVEENIAAAEKSVRQPPKPKVIYKTNSLWHY